LNAEAKRAGRITELTRLVQACTSKGITNPAEIIKIVTKCAYEMASKPIADGYVQ